MAVILAESVAITKSRLTKGFNGDNLNLNGRTVSAEDADRGFKAAGAIKPPYVAVIASGNQKGFAAGAAQAFNDYVKDINLNKYNAQGIIDRFFDDMESVVEKCGIDGGRLSMGIICAYSDCVVAAKTGGCHLLRFSDGELFEIALADEGADRGFQFIDVIADGDMFALIGEECSRSLDYDKIVAAFDTNSELKVMIRDFFNIVAADSKGLDCSVILMRLKCDCERTFASIPAQDIVSEDVSAEFDEGGDTEEPAEFDAEPPVDASELSSSEDVVSDDESPKNGKSVSAKKKIANFIPIAILVIILAVAAALFIATRKPVKTAGEGESNSAESVFDKDLTNAGDDFNGSTGMQTVEDTEYGGNAASAMTATRQNGNADDNNDNDDDNNNSYTPAYVETTARRDVTQAPATQNTSPETTAAPQPETTAAPEEPANEQPEEPEQPQEPAVNEEPAGNDEPVGSDEPAPDVVNDGDSQ